jgi:hypothetical protein
MSSDLGISEKLSNEHIHKCKHAGECSPSKHPTKLDQLLAVVEKISAAALAAFSLYTSWMLFLPFFALGAAVGVSAYYENSSHEHGPVSSCSAGVMEQLTGIRLPRALSLGANIGATLCHIDHHATVFVPIVAISIGAWTGKNAMHGAELLFRKFSVLGQNHTFNMNVT